VMIFVTCAVCTDSAKLKIWVDENRRS